LRNKATRVWKKFGNDETWPDEERRKIFEALEDGLRN
jgi:hypothetical protein